MVKLPFISPGFIKKLELGAVRFNKQGIMHKFEKFYFYFVYNSLSPVDKHRLPHSENDTS